MGTLSQLIVAVLAASGVVAALAVCTVAVRASRRRRDRRRAAMAAPLRPLVLAVATEDPPPPDAVETLAGLGRSEWEAVEPGLVDLLGKVRGTSRTALVGVLTDRGVDAGARRDCTGRRALRRARGAHRLGLLGPPLDRLVDRETPPSGADRAGADRAGAVRPLLGDRHPEVRRVAARSLGRIGDPASVPALLDTLVAPRPVPPRVVSQALLDIGVPAGPALIDAVADPRPAVAAVAVDVLGELRHIPAGAVLVGALAHRDSEVRIRAARALGRIGTPSALDPLLDAAGPDRPTSLRVVALGALRALDDPDTAGTLADLLGDPEPRVAEAAGRALAGLGGPGIRTLASVAARPGTAGRHALAALAAAELAGGRVATRGAAGAVPGDGAATAAAAATATATAAEAVTGTADRRSGR